MYEFEVFMSTMITNFSTVVYADTKSKATYQAYKKWKGKEEYLLHFCGLG